MNQSEKAYGSFDGNIHYWDDVCEKVITLTETQQKCVFGDGSWLLVGFCDGVCKILAVDHRPATHKRRVEDVLDAFVEQLQERAEKHDWSKEVSPLRERFDALHKNLEGIKYASPEYFEIVKSAGVQEHKTMERHHPEFHQTGVLGMNLIDLLEMFADWKACGMSNETLEKNCERFEIPEPLRQILRNTFNMEE